MDKRWIPARAGDALADVDTPALIIELDRFDANVDRLMKSVAGCNVRVRPHAKSHKCVEIARRQLAAGAVGICVQKTSEAEPFLAAGIGDVLVTNEVVGARKLANLGTLAARFPAARLGVCVDDASVVVPLGKACADAGASVDVYVELDVGHDRAGVADPAAAVALGRAVAAASTTDAARSSRPLRSRGPPAMRCAPPGCRATPSPARAPARSSTRPQAGCTPRSSPARTS